jgi:hypothetical protein
MNRLSSWILGAAAGVLLLAGCGGSSSGGSSPPPLPERGAVQMVNLLSDSPESFFFIDDSFIAAANFAEATAMTQVRVGPGVLIFSFFDFLVDPEERSSFSSTMTAFQLMSRLKIA